MTLCDKIKDKNQEVYLLFMNISCRTKEGGVCIGRSSTTNQKMCKTRWDCIDDIFSDVCTE